VNVRDEYKTVVVLAASLESVVTLYTRKKHDGTKHASIINAFRTSRGIRRKKKWPNDVAHVSINRRVSCTRIALELIEYSNAITFMVVYSRRLGRHKHANFCCAYDTEFVQISSVHSVDLVLRLEIGAAVAESAILIRRFRERGNGKAFVFRIVYAKIKSYRVNGSAQPCRALGTRRFRTRVIIIVYRKHAGRIK